MARSTAVTILMADDDVDDRDLTQDAMRKNALQSELRWVEDGEELLDYLNHRGRYSDPVDSPRPGIILLDLNMPRMDGREVLKEIKANPELRRIPIIVLSTSSADEDVLSSYELGANCFITKPNTFDKLVDVVRVLGEHWLETARLPHASVQ
ncbi:response regulator [Hyalangium versicolor]|uniref:response regulator n=1 Tax=Hyalangium versicolor TaxID=2861190 RepID=UPI001CCC3AD1|nr:response regulator [Hyalangium versicolor]